MSLMQSKALGLPVEVAEMIVNWIYRPRDLLSLALSHSTFYRLIVPDHLHYRHVEFCIFDYTMWKYLLEDSSRLKRIETIKLFAHVKPRVPPIMNSSGNQLNTLAEAKKVNSYLIYNALKGMRLLHAVIWDSDEALPNSTTRIMDLQRNIWEAIDRYSPTVRKIDSRGSYSCFRNYIGSEGEPSPPGLQHLILPQAGSHPRGIFDVLAIKLPLLESLTLNGLTNIPIDSVVEFLAAHPLLRALEFSALGGPRSLQYRQAEFCISDYMIWKHLLEAPRWLGRIEVLNLSAEFRSPAPPGGYSPVGKQEFNRLASRVDSDLVQKALKGMRRLYALIWSSNSAPHGAPHAMDLQRHMWKAIDQHCPTVRKVEDFDDCWWCLFENDKEEAEVLVSKQLSGSSGLFESLSYFGADAES
ncbi:hypothetical protein FS837_009054 [Tulasnella sp. UAMH 9824]|nr:hypothetical protein FS837_009054 [Tulasnella sp. UAMH 9824]